MIVLAYAIMSNHFHIFIYVPEPEDIGDEEILRRINALYREKSMREAMGASQGRRHSQQHPFQSLLPFPVAGEGHHCSNRSRSSAVTPAEVLPDMSYYISDTMSISSDPCALPIRATG